MRKARALLICLAAIAVIVLIVTTLNQTFRGPSATKSAALEAVKIATVAYVGACPVLMADHEGYFREEGIAVELTPQANGKAALAEAMQGRANLATVADIPLMYAVLSGEPISVVATMATMEDHAIVARKDRGIVAPSSLKGKRIGISKGTTTQFFLDAFLNREALSPTDVTVLDQTPKQLAQQLASGEIDAAVLYQPFLNVTAAALGNDAVVFSGEAVYDLLFALAGTAGYVNVHHRTIGKVLRATIRGAEFCKKSPDVARDALSKAMQIDPLVLKEIWSSYQFEIALRQGLLLTLEDEARWAIKNKLTTQTKVPNFLENLGLGPLKEVAPTAVTVIH